MGFLRKAIDFIVHPTHSRTMGILVMLVLVAAVSLTVIVAQQQQSLKQRAATSSVPKIISTQLDLGGANAGLADKIDKIWVYYKDGRWVLKNGVRVYEKDVWKLWDKKAPPPNDINDDSYIYPGDKVSIQTTESTSITIAGVKYNSTQKTQGTQVESWIDIDSWPAAAPTQVPVPTPAVTGSQPTAAPTSVVTPLPGTATSKEKADFAFNCSGSILTTDYVDNNYQLFGIGCRKKGSTQGSPPDSNPNNNEVYWISSPTPTPTLTPVPTAAPTSVPRAGDGGDGGGGQIPTPAGIFYCENHPEGYWKGNYTCGKWLGSDVQCPAGFTQYIPDPGMPLQGSQPTNCPAGQGCCKQNTPTTPTPTPGPRYNVALGWGLNIQDVAAAPTSLLVSFSAYTATTNSLVASAQQTLANTITTRTKYWTNITIPSLPPVKHFIFAKTDNNMIAKSAITVSSTANTGSTITITVPTTTTLVFGDINKDNDIDVTDYNSPQNGIYACYGKSIVLNPSCAPSDFDNSGIVDQIDYNTWLRGFATWSKEVKNL